MPLDAMQGQPADIGVKEGFEDVGQLFRPDDGDDELQAALPDGCRTGAGTGASPASPPLPGSTRIAPSPRA